MLLKCSRLPVFLKHKSKLTPVDLGLHYQDNFLFFKEVELFYLSSNQIPLKFLGMVRIEPVPYAALHRLPVFVRGVKLAKWQASHHDDQRVTGSLLAPAKSNSFTLSSFHS